MIDSYEKFLSQYISKDDFFSFGLDETIYMPIDKVEKEWLSLKNRIQKKEKVYVRGYGRDATGTTLFLDFYKHIFEHENIIKDPTNNQQPTKLMEILTGLKKNKNIRNYQVSHIFGRTKNIYTFTAPWNIVFMPKILDPLTGHEAKGSLPEEYQKIFQRKSYEKFKPFIDEYNEIVLDEKLAENIEDYFFKLSKEAEDNLQLIEKFKNSIQKEFAPIYIK